jgi:hypothetical protein
MNEIPPIREHEFYQRFYGTHLKHGGLFHCRHHCKQRKGHCREVLSLLPKKISELDEDDDKRETFWGMYAREAISLYWVVFYNVLSVLPMVAFFFTWMFRMKHLGDLQNASVPLTMVATMLSMFWSTLLGSSKFGSDR